MAITDKLYAIADAIRAKKGVSYEMTMAQMPQEIASIPTGSTDVPFGFWGMNAVKVAEYSESWVLADTTFVVGSTSSTSAVSIKSPVSNYFTTNSIAIGNKDVVVVQRCRVTPQYSGTATNTARARYYSTTYATWISKRDSTATSRNSVRSAFSSNVCFLNYLNTSGSSALAAAAYGLYMQPGNASVGSTTAASTTVRVPSPTFYARANASYASVANQKSITDAAFDWNVEVYLVDPGTTIRTMCNDAVDWIIDQL